MTIFHNNTEYARVSDIIKPFTNFSHIDPEVLQKKAELGTCIHDCIYEYLTGGLPILPEVGEAYFYSFKKWNDAVKPVYIENENRYFDDKLRITGQIDAVVSLPYENLPVLVDFKTSSQESPIPWEMQAHLYAHLLKENDKKIGDRYIFLKLRADGNFPKACEFRYNENTQKKCLKAIAKFWETGK